MQNRTVSTPTVVERQPSRLRTWVRTLRTIIGVPDYERYLRHMQARHPGCAVLTPAEFARERLEARYSRPGSRCC